MLTQISLLVRLVKLIDKVRAPPPPAKLGSGMPRKYTDKLLPKAVIIMIIRHLYNAAALLNFLAQADPTVQELRLLLYIEQLPAKVRYALGDTHYNAPEVRAGCNARGIDLVATRRGAHLHTDGGVEVRRIFHKLRSQFIEPFNGLFKDVFGWSKNMPVKGLKKS